jgi:hypothetical protein
MKNDHDAPAIFVFLPAMFFLLSDFHQLFLLTKMEARMRTPTALAPSRGCFLDVVLPSHHRHSVGVGSVGL